MVFSMRSSANLILYLRGWTFLILFMSIKVDADTKIFQCQTNNKPQRTFEIDYESNQFLKDGKPFRYVSGSIHYFRMPRIYWEDRLRKAKAAGLNAIQTYVEWSQHEPCPGRYDFEGDLDIVHFIKLAQKLDLLVILRPGPYICAERDLGGYPAWLFTVDKDIKLRTSDKNHTMYVAKWFDVLMPKIVPLLYGNGGPIIMVQVENEYGSYYACDRRYTAWLRDLLKRYVNNDAVLFTTDGAGDGFMKCGPIPGVFITVDFGPTAAENPGTAFAVVKRAGQRNGPLVNSEYYTGWLTHWNEEYNKISTCSVVSGLKAILDYTNYTSVNLYMFYGGTNYGFTSGANCDVQDGYLALLTSYDYNAPITEGGDLTDKYYAIQELLSQYDFLKQEKITVQDIPKANYGSIILEPEITLFDLLRDNVTSTKSREPLTFAELRHSHGFVLYSTVLHGQLADPSMLYVPGLRDRAIVFVDEERVGILSRFRNIYEIPIVVKSNQTLNLLVESQGHVNYGTYINDTKGIVCNVHLNGKILLDWEMKKVPLNTSFLMWEKDVQLKKPFSPPAYYSGAFQIPENEGGHDTYLNLSGWGKGVAFLNGFNLGRYWVNTGSQVTLYVPANLFQPYPAFNRLTIFELEHEHSSNTASFQNNPVINSSVPALGTYGNKCQMIC